MRDPGSDVGRYLGGLDGLRAVACLTVLAAHCIGHFAPVAAPRGSAQILVQGMTIFFVLSGLLIYLPFARALIGTAGPVQVGRYARRRLMRIFPAYLVIFLLANLVLGVVYVRNALDVARPLTDAGSGRLTDALDVLLHLSLLQTFVPAQMQTGIPPAWSLTTELSFYLALPFVVLAVAGRPGRLCGTGLGRALVPPLAFFAVGIVGRLVLAREFASSGLTIDQAEFGSNGLAVLARSLLVYADTFALGMAVAVAFAWTEGRRSPQWTSLRASGLGAALMVVGALGGLLLLERNHWFVGTFTGLAAAGLVLLVADPTARGADTWVSRVAGLLPLRFVGEISYSVYLWHVPVILLVSRLGWFHTDSLPTLVGATSVVALVSIGLASLTFRWIERPAMAWASR